MEVTYYGHSCFLVETGNSKILFDPFITGNSLASHIDINKIEADYILLSHGHADHVGDVEAIAKRTGAMIVGPFETVSWFGQKGLEKNHGMNPGGKARFDFGTVKMVSAIHSSSMPDGSYGGVATGFVIETAEKTFYYSGDTALTTDMRLIKDRYKLDFAFLCIGDTFTMDIEDAVVAAEYTGTSKIIGMHYNTFPVIELDAAYAQQVAQKAGKELVLFEIGQTIKL
ncbi:metal-dependent hydrolase [Cytophagaceae bacterium ABcell3]|nr:metal-dependent hydrolase [Cytophagaceae bacterium ABcell3]